MSDMAFADVVNQSISFSYEQPGEKPILELIDNRWLQRLRDISQTANTRLVFMFSEHSRFGHCLGVAYLACQLLKKLEKNHPQVAEYRDAITTAALLHDIGHLAPGSHIAQKCWFPDQADSHELIATRIIKEDLELQKLLQAHDRDLSEQVIKILLEDPGLPPWTWQIISGGGWNVDRGNWCIVDSVLAGVSYGKYNIPALTDSLVITSDGQLGLRENRLDAMMHFAVSRHAMYSQVYQHRVLLTSDVLTRAIVRRARNLGQNLQQADDAMRAVLAANSPAELSLENIYNMREAWWRYHLQLWSNCDDVILSDLADRLLNRRLFKTIRLGSLDREQDTLDRARIAVTRAGYDPAYYLYLVSTMDVHAGDSKQSIKVVRDDGRIQSLSAADPLFQALIEQQHQYKRSWLALPQEAKNILELENENT